MPEYAKDVEIALLGASVGLAGLLLVVSGFVFAQVNTFPPETTDDSILKRYEMAAKLGLIPFAVALVEAALSLMWLLRPSEWLYRFTAEMFFLLLLLAAVYGAVLVLRYL